MTAKMIFANFQSLFPEFSKRVEKYKRVDANTIQMSMKGGGICSFQYSKGSYLTGFSLSGKVHEGENKK